LSAAQLDFIATGEGFDFDAERGGKLNDSFPARLSTPLLLVAHCPQR
jgi:hypothetical protein